MLIALNMVLHAFSGTKTNKERTGGNFKIKSCELAKNGAKKKKIRKEHTRQRKSGGHQTPTQNPPLKKVMLCVVFSNSFLYKKTNQ